MDAERVRGTLQHYFERSAAGDEDEASEIYVEDAVLEFPKSGERFEGVANFKGWRAAYPAASVDYRIDRVRGGGDVWTAEVRISYDGGTWMYGVDVLEFRGEQVARETVYVMDGWEAPEWRARWAASSNRPPDPAAGVQPGVNRLDSGGAGPLG